MELVWKEYDNNNTLELMNHKLLQIELNDGAIVTAFYDKDKHQIVRDTYNRTPIELDKIKRYALI